MAGLGLCSRGIVETLGLELRQPGAKPTQVAAARVAVDQTTQLGHGPTGIAEPVFGQLGQGEADADVLTRWKRVPGPEILQLDGGRLGFAQDAAQKRCPPQRRLRTVRCNLGTLAVELRRLGAS